MDSYFRGIESAARIAEQAAEIIDDMNGKAALIALAVTLRETVAMVRGNEKKVS